MSRKSGEGSKLKSVCNIINIYIYISVNVDKVGPCKFV